MKTLALSYISNETAKTVTFKGAATRRYKDTLWQKAL